MCEDDGFAGGVSWDCLIEMYVNVIEMSSCESVWFGMVSGMGLRAAKN